MPEVIGRPAAQAATAVQLGAPLELKPAADGGLPAKFAGRAYSGGFVPGYEMVIDLSTTTYRSRMPLLNSHIKEDIVGVIDQASTDRHQMTVSGQLFSDMPGSSAERIAQLAQRGAPFEMSVGLYGFTREFVPAGKSVQVNGQTFNGPVNVLRNGQVREVSVVTLGADPRTDSKFFEQPSQGAPSMNLTAEQLAAQVAQLTAQVESNAAALQAAVAAATAEGATAERERIKSVQAQALPGHDKLIAELMFDGKTTGPQAAVAVLNAERALRGAAAVQLAADAPAPVAAAATPLIEAAAQDPANDNSLPLEERCKAKWERSPDLRAEFANLAAYTAFSKAAERGAARIFSRKEA